MSWSWKIARLAGINVYMHATFPLLLAWSAYEGYALRHSAADAGWAVGLVLSLFTIVVMHEYGHALAARRYGIRTRDIILLPIGGVARLESIPEKPLQEIVVALAGPAVNVVLAALLFPVVYLAAAAVPDDPLVTNADLAVAFLGMLLVMNLTILLFNLVPAFPMDGGRVLRAVLALRLDYVRATRVAATIGQGIALLFGLLTVLGLAGIPVVIEVPLVGVRFGFDNPFLLLLALFVWRAAAAEAAAVAVRHRLGGVAVQQAMTPAVHVLRPTDTLAFAAGLVDGEPGFPVVDGDQLVGLLPTADLRDALDRHGPGERVGAVMRRDFVAVGPFLPLAAALPHLGTSPVLPVVHAGRLVGLLTREGVGARLAAPPA